MCSLRYEQYNSLRRVRIFLRGLLTVHAYPKNKKDMRRQASDCLRHFPHLYDSGEPMWSQDDFTKDKEYKKP